MVEPGTRGSRRGGQGREKLRARFGEGGEGGGFKDNSKGSGHLGRDGIVSDLVETWGRGLAEAGVPAVLVSLRRSLSRPGEGAD